MKNLSVSFLSTQSQQAISSILSSKGFTSEDITNALDSRICDLEDAVGYTQLINIINQYEM